MPRNGSGVYSKASVTLPASGQVISSADHNATIDDLVTDANTARPIVAGGTGATSASAARTALAVPGTGSTETISGAWTFTGGVAVTTTAATVADSVKLNFGAGTDGSVFSDGTDTIIEVRDGTTLRFRNANGENLFRMFTNSGFTASFNNADLLEGLAGGIRVTGDLILKERSDHASTPAAGHGYVWVKDDAPSVLKFTDDAGTDFDVATATSVATAIAANYGEVSPVTLSGAAPINVSTAIPAEVVRFDVIIAGISVSGTDDLLLQLSTGAAFATTGYDSGGGRHDGATPTSTAGFILESNSSGINNAAGILSFAKTPGSNRWTMSGTVRAGGAYVLHYAGSCDLGGVLDGIRITVTGANTFTAGTVSVMYWKN